MARMCWNFISVAAWERQGRCGSLRIYSIKMHLQIVSDESRQSSIWQRVSLRPGCSFQLDPLCGDILSPKGFSHRPPIKQVCMRVSRTPHNGSEQSTITLSSMRRLFRIRHPFVGVVSFGLVCFAFDWRSKPTPGGPPTPAQL